MLFDTLALCSLFVVLLLLKRLVNVYPSLLACLLRSKECFNLEASVKLARDRNLVTIAMVVPFCLIAFKYGLYRPDFLDGMGEDVALGVYVGVFAVYAALRYTVLLLVIPRRVPQKTSDTANKAAFSFFNVLTFVLLAMGGVMDLLNVDESVVHNAMLWVSGCIYLLFLIRKAQIFNTSCSIFASFLYLCALEIMPTGILVVSAVIF